MGKNTAAKRAANGVRNSNTNYKIQIMNLRRCFPVVAILGVFLALTENAFAQNNLDTFAQIVNRGNTEQKRDVLIRIRNLENAEASRVAIPLLRDSSEIVRAAAAFSVIYLPKDEATRNLLPLLNDKSAFVRRETAYALGKIQNQSATNPLLKTFQTDKIPEVKTACVVALGEIGDVAAIEILTAILRTKPEIKEEFLRRGAARSIGQIARIIQTGEAKVITPENFLPENSRQISKAKYPKLVEIFPVFRAAIDVLIETLKNPREFADAKREAAFALGAIGDESAAAILQANVSNEDYYLARISQESLRKIFSNKQ